MSSEPIRHAPIDLWRTAQAFLNTLIALFGEPVDVARQHTFRSEAYTLLLSWIRCAEAMLRHLLLIEAAAYPKPNTRPLLHAKRQRVRKPAEFDPERPETWRAGFRCFTERRPRAPKPKQAPTVRAPARRVSREDRWSSERWKPAKFNSAFPIARRFQALIRVFHDPAGYARRLHATPHRARELTRAPPEAPHRIDNYDKLCTAALKARFICDTS